MALAVFPVPCSLKQNPFWCKVRNDAVETWWSNGLYRPVHVYFTSMGDGDFIPS
jgi:hypothetical protein